MVQQTAAALEKAAAEEARAYLGGEIARSAQKNRALLARFRRVLRALLAQVLEKIGEALTDGDGESARVLLIALEEGLEQVLRLALTYASTAAREEILRELTLLFPDSSPEDRLQQRPEEVLDFERLKWLVSRFTRDLAGEIPRRFQLAELLEESPETAAASLTRNTVLGRGVSSRFGARLSTIAISEWTLAANQTRCMALSDASRDVPQLRVKFLYFGTGPCDGTCVAWAQGGEGGEGIYVLAEAPMPVEDTHPNCRCVLAPWLQKHRSLLDVDRRLLESLIGGEEYSYFDPEFRRGFNEGFIESINLPAMLGGIWQAAKHLWTSESKWETAKEFGKAAAKGTWQSLEDLSAEDPYKRGRARGSTLIDILLSPAGGASVAKAGTRGVSTIGKAATITGKVRKVAKKAASISKKARKAIKKAAKGGKRKRARAKPWLSRAVKKVGKAAKKPRTWRQIKRALRRGRIGELRLGKWLEKSGRKFILDPRKKRLNAPGPDAITYRWEGNRCIVELWDNKAWKKSRAVSGSKALERLGRGKAFERELPKWLEKSGLERSEARRILKAMDENRMVCDLIMSNAGGRARAGPSLTRKGIRFQHISD